MIKTPNPQLIDIDKTMEMNLLQSKKIVDSVDNLEPIMEGILVKTNELVKEAKKPSAVEIEINGAETTYYKGEKGDKGDSPSDEELVKLIKPLIPEPKNGKDGKSVDKKELVKELLQIVLPEIPTVEEVASLIPVPRDGVDGLDGLDAEVNVDSIVETVLSKIPKVKNGSPDTGKQIKDKLLKTGLSYDDLKDAPNIDQITRNLHKVASKTVSLSELDDVNLDGLTQTNGKYDLGSGSGGGSNGEILATEIPNGSRTSFTFSTATAKPDYIVMDNVWMKDTSSSGTVNWTWDNGTKVATMSVPPVDDIWGLESFSGVDWEELPATQTPDGSIVQFTFATATAQPRYIVADNVWMKATSASGTVNWTWNSGTSVATLSVAPVDDIWAVRD